ncbi:MAG: NAD(P)/FAD-dependent oxidoreductase [Bacteroidetes bacterium]|nr:NAD(P)/FAD-dependent oxidoreductase [Bacteroidota bacterium]
MKKKVIVVGGGFAGLQIVRRLNRKFYDVLLIDRVNHHQFQPLFYQVATSQIEPSSISFPLRNVFKGYEATQIRLGEVIEIKHYEDSVITNQGVFEYDYLIIATGCKTNFFNNNAISQHALTLKSTYDAITIRNQILTTFEETYNASRSDKKSLLNLVIVGAGPTGVELAGAFAEIKNMILPKDYPDIDFSEFTIYLIEAAQHALNGMSSFARKASAMYLSKIGVKVITGVFVKNYDGQTASLSDGTEIATRTLIWAAGVVGNKIPGMPEHLWVNNSRLLVNRYNQVQGFQNIFAVGDIALMKTPKFSDGHPQVANVAISQAKLLAVNLKRILTGKPMVCYEYRDIGTMATIGRGKAVVDLPFASFKGYFAWIVWLSLHLMFILSVRNKLIIFINWAWNYFSKNSALRLILKPPDR